METVMVFCTFPSADKAAEICETLVQERLVACANLLPQVRSIYRWQGAVEDDEECLALLKTQQSKLAALSARVVELHPYDCPEVVATPIVGGYEAYLRWVREETS